METTVTLEEWFASVESAVLGYSGGVDSAVVAVVAARVLGPERFLAVIGKSPSYPASQWQRARSLAGRFNIPVLELDTAELLDPVYRSNPTDRCYYCKRELWSQLARIQEARGFAQLIDGTNAEDRDEHRPGARAGAEARVRSPLDELGWSKSMVRRAALELGLPNWDAPAEPCLSSRIRFGLEVTPERLRQVELAEARLRTIGVTVDLRVRHHAQSARIEVSPAMFDLVDRNWPEVEQMFVELGFESVSRDPRGYRRGSLLPIADGVS